MKKIFYLVSLLSLTFCKAQIPTIDLYGNEDYGANGSYYKDINGFQNQYIGSWLYTNGNTSLKIIFQKRNKILKGNSNHFYYVDFLIGEYQYIENGIEKVNTLNQVNTNYGSNYEDIQKHNLYGEIAINIFNRPKCTFCIPNEKRLEMGLNEPKYNNLKGLSNSFILKTFTENGLTKLKVWFISEIKVMPEDENDNPVNFTGFSLPFGEYTLIKQ